MMIDIFYEKYKLLHDKEKDNFSRLVHKLLSVNYLTNQKEADIKDYYFLSAHYELFKSYFSLSGCEFYYDTTYHLFILTNKSGFNHFRLRLNESILLLILRLLYDEKMREISLTNKVIVDLSTIHQKFLSTGLKDRRLSKTELKQILSTFRHYNLIDLLDTNIYDDNNRLIIYPSILYAVHIEDINELYDKIMAYKKDRD